MHHPTDRIAHITAFVTPVLKHWLEREIAQWIDPTTHERMLLPWSYISLPISISLVTVQLRFNKLGHLIAI